MSIENLNYQDVAHHTFKIVIVGNQSVGKTSFYKRLTTSKFDLLSTKTIGIEFSSKIININGYMVRASLWDNVGNIKERFKPMIKSFYQNTDGIFVAFDITDRESFHSIEDWLDEIHEHCSINVKLILVGTKSDLELDRKVSIKEGQDLAKFYNIPFIEISSLSDKNVDKTLRTLLEEVYLLHTNIPEQSFASLPNSFNKTLNSIGNSPDDSSNSNNSLNNFNRNSTRISIRKKLAVPKGIKLAVNNDKPLKITENQPQLKQNSLKLISIPGSTPKERQNINKLNQYSSLRSNKTISKSQLEKRSKTLKRSEIVNVEQEESKQILRMSRRTTIGRKNTKSSRSKSLDKNGRQKAKSINKSNISSGLFGGLWFDSENKSSWSSYSRNGYIYYVVALIGVCLAFMLADSSDKKFLKSES